MHESYSAAKERNLTQPRTHKTPCGVDLPNQPLIKLRLCSHTSINYAPFCVCVFKTVPLYSSKYNTPRRCSAYSTRSSPRQLYQYMLSYILNAFVVRQVLRDWVHGSSTPCGPSQYRFRSNFAYVAIRSRFPVRRHRIDQLCSPRCRAHPTRPRPRQSYHHKRNRARGCVRSALTCCHVEYDMCRECEWECHVVHTLWEMFPISTSRFCKKDLQFTVSFKSEFSNTCMWTAGPGDLQSYHHKLNRARDSLLNIEDHACARVVFTSSVLHVCELAHFLAFCFASCS